MCGIAGFIGQDREKIERMLRTLIHRGPDGHAIEVLPNAMLGHARLAILDPRPEANQPMWNDTKTLCIVFNGEIYNFKQLQKEESFECKTRSDTEVLLRLFERYGTSFLPRIHGMFAFGIYNVKEQSLTLARDQNGIKPLYIAFPDGKLHFASEMRSLMKAFSVKPKLNMRSLSRYLRMQYVPGPETMCEGIESVLPGSIIEWKNNNIIRSTYKRVSKPMQWKNRQDFMSTIPSIIDESVQAEMIADRPIGIFLSGGMDSSIVLHHMTQHATKRIKTFTVRFEATQEEGATRFNADADLAKLTAKHYGTDHTELLLTAEMFRNHYAETCEALDQPNSDHVSVAQFLLARLAKKSVDVVLTGAGGDELFGGYPRYRIAYMLHALRYIPSQMRGWGSIFGYPKDVLELSTGAALAERLLCRPSTEWNEVVNGEWFEEDAATEFVFSAYETSRAETPVRSLMNFDRATWLIDESLRLVDGTTMASGLEARVPFLAPDIIDASLGTKDNWHLGLFRTKTGLKDAYRQLLPDHLFTLKKASFYPPLAKWLRREAAPLVDEALEHGFIRQYFNATALHLLFMQHKERTRYSLHVLHGIVQLSAWVKRVYQ